MKSRIAKRTKSFCLLPLAFCLLPFLCGCARQTESLPIHNQLPDFVLTAQTGEEFRGASLKGKVWVADFIFTNCTGPCPRMSFQMRQMQTALKDHPEVKLVSFTVDPERDTPDVLAAYAGRYQAEAGRWFFLTGPQETLHHLSREAFKVGNVDGSLDHSTYFVLVDQQSRVRGYYGTTEGGALKKLVSDVTRLLGEES